MTVTVNKKSTKKQVKEDVSLAETELSEDQVKSEVDSMSDKEVMENYLSDPKVKETLRKAADELSGVFRDKWFSLSQMNKKTRFKVPSEAASIMNFLILADLAGMRQDRKMVEYKLVINKQEKAAIIQLQIDHLKSVYEKQLELLERELKRYMN